MMERLPPDRVNRTHVLWLGDAVPVGLHRHVLNLVPRAITASELNDAAPTACLLIIPVAPEIADASLRYGTLVGQARNHGLRIVLVPDRPVACDELETYLHSTNSLAVVKGVRRIGGFDDHLLDEAQRPPEGKGANRRLQLSGDVPDENTTVLLQRAFEDASALHLHAVQGGKSGAWVWRVHWHDGGGHPMPLPLLVKVASVEKIAMERSNARHIANLIPGRCRPGVHLDRGVEGATHGLMVFDFFNNAQGFDAAICSNPAVVLASLLGTTLKHVVEAARAGHSNVAQSLRDMKAFRTSPALAAAADLAAVHVPELGSIETLDRRWRALPPSPHRVGPVHGDLHTGNLFLAPTSSEVLIIDFGSFRAIAPACADLACLEVSIVFPQGQGIRPPEIHDQIRTLYFVDDLPPTYGSSEMARLQEVIRAIRQWARTIEPDAAVLALAQAAYLIRYASYEDSGALEERALAYELAYTLLARVEAAYD